MQPEEYEQPWKFRELTGPSWSVPDNPEMDLLHRRCADSFAEMQRQMNIGIYGDREPPKQLTHWQRLSGRLRLYRQRISDAWLVLTGRAEIGDW